MRDPVGKWLKAAREWASGRKRKEVKVKVALRMNHYIRR